MSGLSGEESPQEKEERLQSREDRLGKQHARLQERGSGHDNLSIGGGGGGGAGRLGGQKPTGESFIGEHKVGIFVAAGVVVLAFYLWTAHTNSSTSPQDALAGGTSTSPAGSTGAGPNVGTTNDAGTTYGINQLTQQLAAIQTSLTNSLNGTPATGSANLPAANGGGGPQSLIAIATPDATNQALNYTPATATSPALAQYSYTDASGNILTPEQQNQAYGQSLAAATKANIPGALSTVNANLATKQAAYTAAAQTQTAQQQSIQASAVQAYNQNQADLGSQGNAQILAARQAANPGYTVSPPVWNAATGTYIYNNY